MVVVVLAGEPPVIEVNCHGGIAAVTLVIESLQLAGAMIADGLPPTEYLSRDRITRDALADLVRTPRFQPPRSCSIRRRVPCAIELMRLGQSMADAPIAPWRNSTS